MAPRNILLACLLSLAGCATGVDAEPVGRSASPYVGGVRLTPTYEDGVVELAFLGMSGSAGDRVVLAEPGDGDDVVLASFGTDGRGYGTLEIADLVPGTYVARAYFDWDGTSGHQRRGESVEFTVEPAEWGTPALSTAPEVAPGEDVVVVYDELAGYLADSLTIAHAGDPAEAALARWKTGGARTGTKTFSGLALTDGAYVVRFFMPGSTAPDVEVPFEVRTQGEMPLMVRGLTTTTPESYETEM